MVVAHGLPDVSRSNPPSMRSGLMATSCRCNVSVSPCSSVSLGTTGLAQRENCGGRVAWLQVCSFPRLVCLLPSLTTLHGLFYHVEPHRSWNFRESCALRARLLNSDLHRLHSADELPGLNVASGTRQLETMWRFKKHTATGARKSESERSHRAMRTEYTKAAKILVKEGERTIN